METKYFSKRGHNIRKVNIYQIFLRGLRGHRGEFSRGVWGNKIEIFCTNLFKNEKY